MPFFKTAACACAVGLLAAPGIARPSSGFHWERLRVLHISPTELFAKLGLTHITRNGYTRGLKKGTPDPDFPPGLTDVVPYDAGHALLVRGTAAGVSLFRRRVVAADVPDPRWQASLTLLRKDDDSYQTVATQTHEILSDIPVTVGFDHSTAQYQLKVHVNRDGSLAVTCQAALPLAPLPGDGATVLVPTQVWTAPVTKDTRPGDPLTFDDLAADRTAARQKLGQAPGDSSDDYQVQVQLTPEPPADTPPTLIVTPGGPTQ